MYSIARISHQRYGDVIEIIRSVDCIQCTTPFHAVQEAIKERRLWLEAGTKKVRILVDDQIMSPRQAEIWSKTEYASLPKCYCCAKILQEKVFTNSLSPFFFCSQECADKNYNEDIERQKDEEEFELP